MSRWPWAIPKSEVQFSLRKDDGSLAAIDADGDDGTWQVTTLDRFWKDRGRPKIAMIKIDVEGYEPQVIHGARELLTKERPDLMLEANDDHAMAELVRLLSRFGYGQPHQPKGFQSYNYLFTAK